MPALPLVHHACPAPACPASAAHLCRPAVVYLAEVGRGGFVATPAEEAEYAEVMKTAAKARQRQQRVALLLGSAPVMAAGGSRSSNK